LLLVRPIEGNDRTVRLRRALDLCHIRHGWNLPVRAGLARDGKLVLMTRVNTAEFRPDTVEQAFDLLTRLHDRVSHR
ncbi:MAG TPA: hypothetical protein VHW01_24095, partial [Polyangiaceae bacterium]|nr:hypothetical protein [Polyangiaceae bacterium]